MALNSSTVINTLNPKTKTEAPVDYSPLLLLLLAVAYHYSKKQMRKAKRKMIWQLMKMKLKSMLPFKGKNGKKMSLLGKLGLISLAVGILGGLIWGIGLGLVIWFGSFVIGAFLILFGAFGTE